MFEKKGVPPLVNRMSVPEDKSADTALMSDKCSNNPRVFAKLFLHSAAMFTLPFVAYFFAKRLVMEEYDMTEEQGYVYGAIAAVITVNVVIGSYVYQALTDDDQIIPNTSQQIKDKEK